MKNFIFKSSLDKDLFKILQSLDIIQKEQRHARYDLQEIERKLDITVKGIALMVAAPTEELEDGTDNSNTEGA